MSLLTALALEPFMVNQTLLESLLLEPDAIEVWLTADADAGPGDGSILRPFRANAAAIFDALMRSFPPNTTVHLRARCGLARSRVT